MASAARSLAAWATLAKSFFDSPLTCRPLKYEAAMILPLPVWEGLRVAFVPGRRSHVLDAQRVARRQRDVPQDAAEGSPASRRAGHGPVDVDLAAAGAW